MTKPQNLTYTVDRFSPSVVDRVILGADLGGGGGAQILPKIDNYWIRPASDDK